MTPHTALVLATFSLATTCIIVAGFVLYAMIGEINRRLSDNDQIGYLWFYQPKIRRIFREYKRLYPNGRLGLAYKVLTATGCLAMAVCAWSIEMFR